MFRLKFTQTDHQGPTFHQIACSFYFLLFFVARPISVKVNLAALVPVSWTSCCPSCMMYDAMNEPWVGLWVHHTGKCAVLDRITTPVHARFAVFRIITGDLPSFAPSLTNPRRDVSQADSTGKTPVFQIPGLSLLLRGSGGQLVSYSPAFLSLSQLKLTLEIAKERTCKSWLAGRALERRNLSHKLDAIAVIMAGDSHRGLNEMSTDEPKTPKP